MTADNLSPKDLRSPMFKLMDAEGKGQVGRSEPTTTSTTASSSTGSANPSSTGARVARPGLLQQKSKGRRHFLPTTVCNRVEQSWKLVSDNLEELGIDFFVKVFEESPELLNILPYGRVYLDSPPEVRSKKLRSCPTLKVHAIHVMTAVGNCVAGLKDIEALAPSLRSLGKTHRMVGVEDDHYKMLFKPLSAAIKQRIGPDKWDEETAKAWELVYCSLASIMSRPAIPLEAEPVTGWHKLLVLASLYFVVFAPFRLAGFTANVTMVEVIFTVFDVIALCFFIIDFSSSWIVNALRVKPRVAVSWNGPKLKCILSLQRRINRAITTPYVYARRHIRKLQMDQWVSWPKTDLLVIMSFALQYAQHIIYIVTSGSMVDAPRVTAGVSWLHVLGLLRMAAMTRVIHGIRCIENNMLLRSRLEQNERTMLRIAKLVVTLVYVTHVSACLWCVVARVQLDPAAPEANPSEFFPEPSLLIGGTGVFNSYSRAFHWSWVNLAGIGNVDSAPVSTLECMTMILIHVFGVTLYAITTGNVVSILEDLTSKDNEIGSDLANLGNFMVDCSVPADVQERIMQGYLMRNIIGDSDEDSDKGREVDVPSIDEEVMERLPEHLQSELKMYSRAEIIQRRDKSFKKYSAEFLYALSSELRGNMVLLPGDYLLKDGKPPRQVLILESGTLEVDFNGQVIKILRTGEVLGKRWLLKALSRTETIGTDEAPDLLPTEKRAPSANSFSEWLDIREETEVTIRAISECHLASGLSATNDVHTLRNKFPEDFDILEDERKRALAAFRKVNFTRVMVKAQMAFKRGLKQRPIRKRLPAAAKTAFVKSTRNMFKHSDVSQ